MELTIDYLDYQTTFQTKFTQHYLNKKPCIIRGCVTQWPAKNWDFDSLKKMRLKGEPTGNLTGITIKDPVSEVWYKCYPHQLAIIRETLKIKTLEYEASEWLFSISHPEMLEAIKIPKCLKSPQWLDRIPLSMRPIYPRILVGYQDTGSDLHIDLCNTPNWMGLVRGIKRWFVVDPEEGKKIHNYLDTFTQNTQKMKDKVRDYYEFELKAGEMVYLPAKWLHQVYNVEDSIAITYNIFNLIQVLAYIKDYSFDYQEIMSLFEEVLEVGTQQEKKFN